MTSTTRLTQFKNCRILRNHQLIKDDIWVRDGKIINPEKVFYDEQRLSNIQIDCNNAIVSPGFIDIQINGGYGVDFSYDVDTVEEGVQLVAKKLLEHGVTSFCPTIVTSPHETYVKVLPKIPKKAGSKAGASILGVHVEGPFINVEKKGAHPPKCIKELTEGFKTLEGMYGSLDNIKIVSLAPEKENAIPTITELHNRGIAISLGHSMADLSEGELAVQHGANLITHLFNAMLPFHHRDPGLVGLLTSTKIPEGRRVFYGIIADGVHTHPAALRIAYRTNYEGLILVTDAISALGLEEGMHHIGQMDVEVRASRAYVAGTTTLCGSIAPMDECIRIFQQSTKCSTVHALESATLHPAQSIRMEKVKGTLDFEADADFVFLSDDLSVLSTWIAGECVFRNNF